MKTRFLSLMLVLVMCVSLTALLCGCNDSKSAATTDEPIAATKAQTQQETQVVDPLWENATYTEDVTIGEGEKSIAVQVKAGEKAITVTINTSAENLEDALTGVALVEGEEGAYGLYIKTVNGILADYDVDQSYWAMYKDGEYLTSGANQTIITSGEHYEIVYTK